MAQRNNWNAGATSFNWRREKGNKKEAEQRAPNRSHVPEWIVHQTVTFHKTRGKKSLSSRENLFRSDQMPGSHHPDYKKVMYSSRDGPVIRPGMLLPPAVPMSVAETGSESGVVQRKQKSKKLLFDVPRGTVIILVNEHICRLSKRSIRELPLFGQFRNWVLERSPGWWCFEICKSQTIIAIVINSRCRKSIKKPINYVMI